MNKTPWRTKGTGPDIRLPEKPKDKTSWWLQATGEPLSEWRARVNRESVSRFVNVSGTVYEPSRD